MLTPGGCFGARIGQGAGKLRCRYPSMFWKVPLLILGKVPEGIAGEVPEGFGADSW